MSQYFFFREKAREQVLHARDGGQSSSNRIVPEIEHLLPTKVEDIGTHTVSITHINSLDGLTSGPQNNSEVLAMYWPRLQLDSYLLALVYLSGTRGECAYSKRGQKEYQPYAY